MGIFRQIQTGFGTFGELLAFLRNNKRWWLIPFVVVLGLFSLLLILGQATPLGPFVYSLF
jgi:ABC-type microcin C transport system permease subunit YejE